MLEQGLRMGKFCLGKDILIVGKSGSSHISVEDYAMVDELVSEAPLRAFHYRLLSRQKPPCG